jgi:hypothetical protein
MNGYPTTPLPLFAAGSATSHAAAVAIRDHAPRQRDRVYAFIAAHPMTTRENIAAGLGMRLSSATARVCDLTTEGFVWEADGAGKTTSGRPAGRLMVTAKPFSESSRAPASVPTVAPKATKSPVASQAVTIAPATSSAAPVAATPAPRPPPRKSKAGQLMLPGFAEV